MIEIKNLTYHYPKTTTPTLHNLNLSLLEGEFVLLVGPSGAGKSTLLRCLNGLVPHFSGGHLRGKLQVNGLNPVTATPQTMSHHVGFVFQDPEAQFVMDRVEDELAFALENAALPPAEMRIRVEEVLDLLDLAPLRARRLEKLSGGEKQRVAIAAVLALRPQILLLDEPTSQLDPKSAEDVLQTLVRLNSDLGLTVLLAEHRLERVLPFVDQLLYLPANSATEPLRLGPPKEILPLIPLQPPLVRLSQLLEWPTIPLTIKEGRRQSRRWLRGQTINPMPSPPHADTPAAPVLETRQLVVTLDGDTVLHGVDLAVQAGEIVALMGRNGSGKTTLLRSLVGLLSPERGEVLLHGQSIAGRAVAEICQQVSYLPQDPNALLFAETVWEELLITLKNHGLTAETAPVNPHDLLEALGLSAKADCYPRDLSVGERQRVALAALLVTKPQILLLDEPTRGLDYQAKEGLLGLLRRWQAEGLAIVLVTHDVELAAQAAERVVLLSQGEVIAAGAPGDILAASPLFAPQVARLFPNTGWLTVADVARWL